MSKVNNQIVPSGFRFPRSEKLKHKKDIECLFKNGESVFKYPIKVLFTLQSESNNSGIKVAFSVPKRHHKLAVTRNKIKRQLREHFRLNVRDLREALTQQCSELNLMFIFVAKENVPSAVVKEAMIYLLDRLTDVCKQKAF